MKSLKYIVLLLSISLFASCLQTDGVFESVSGEEVLLDLKCVNMSAEEVIVTKAWEDATGPEQYIRDLRVYIFSTSGSLVGYGVFGNSALVDNNDYGYWRNLENIKTKTGNVYIYAVANISTSQYALSNEDLKLLTNIDPQNLSDSDLNLTVFRNIKFKRTKDGLNPLDERFMMVGTVNEGNAITIGRNGNEATITSPTEEDKKELRLHRILSKNTINISAVEGASFTLTSYGLYNVPNGGALVKTAEHTATFDTGYPNEFARQLTTDPTSFSFYLPENMAGSGQNINSWIDREKNSYDADGLKSFTNAPENSTYIVLRGTYSKNATQEGQRDIQADVEYTIHFGDFSKDNSDYNIERNFSYVYNVTVSGVNQIIVEADVEQNEDRPSTEGIVLEKANANSIMEVDCHYEARVFQFTKDDTFIADATKGLMLRLETPFGTSKVLYVRNDGIYDGPTGEGQKIASFTDDGKINPEELRNCIESGNELDYNWLHFVRNTTGNRMTTGDDLTNVAKYPGDGHATIMDVFSFLRQLGSDAISGSPTTFFTEGDTEYVTCFIDENYYPSKSWAEYVNKEEGRTAFFLTEKFNVSTDKKSIHAVIKYAIHQKSIWTFYNPAMAATVKAFGVESVSEETISSTTDNTITTGLHNDNGFTAANTYQSGQDFYIGSLDTRPGEQNQYTTKLKACMSRNRDADGDGTINNNEMRWYLATINQYKGLYAGLDVLPTSARLFDINEMQSFNSNISHTDLAEYHYYTASSGSNGIYWAEEAVSTSSVGGWLNNYSYAKHVRCVRTLESGANGETDPHPFYEITGNIVDLSKVNPGALRPYQNGGFPSHYETDDQNKLYARFEIASSRLTTQPEYTAIKGTETIMLTADEDVCQQAEGYGGAWRVPNSRELSLMLIAVDLGNNNYWASTRFNGNRYGANGAGYKPFDDYKGFCYWTDGGWGGGTYRMTIESKSNSGYVRCVRDVQLAKGGSEYNYGGGLTQ